MHAPAQGDRHAVHILNIKSSQVKSSQVKSSQVKSMGGRERVCDEQLRGTFFPADGSVAVAMSLADFDTGCKTGEMRPGRFVRIVGGETLVCTHGTYESRYKAQTGRRTSAKAEEELEKERAARAGVARTGRAGRAAHRARFREPGAGARRGGARSAVRRRV